MAIASGQKYLHKKSGHIVEVMYIAFLQTAQPSHYLPDECIMIVYRHNGNVWVRAAAEFQDGRFVRIEEGK